jgi:hypothetical protein
MASASYMVLPLAQGTEFLLGEQGQLASGDQGIHFLLHTPDIGEGAIDAGEADISDIIQLP